MLQFKYSEFPILETERLLLRRMVSTDAETMFDLRNREEVMQFIARPRPKSIDEANEMIHKINESIDNKELIHWAISEKENPNKLIGTIGFYRTQFENYRSEIGYLLDSNFWRRGYMYEAVMAAVDFGFTSLGFHSMEGCIDPGNTGSRAVLIKAGFRKEAHYKENYHFEGKFLDSEVYGLLKSEYLEQMNKRK